MLADVCELHIPLFSFSGKAAEGMVKEQNSIAAGTKFPNVFIQMFGDKTVAKMRSKVMT